MSGNVFGLRESRSAAVQGPPVPTETNVLKDGTLIDLCGATLLWRYFLIHSRVTCAGRYSLLLIQFVPDLPKASVVLPPLVSLSGVWTNSTQEGLNALLDFTHSSCLGNFREFFHDNNIGRYFLGRFEALRGGTEFRTTHVGANKNPCTSFVELCGIFP